MGLRLEEMLPAPVEVARSIKNVVENEKDELNYPLAI